MTIAYQIIDAFTSKAYAGNPAAVLCLPSRASGVAPPSDAWHLSLAREFNLAETAFLTELEDSTPTAPHYLIRWFTTGIAFETTMAGPLSAKRVAGGDKIELDFPADHQLLEFAPEGWVAADVVAAAEAANPAFVGKVLGWGRGKVLGWVIEIAADVKLEGISLDTKAFIPLGGYVVFTQAGTDPAGPHIKSRVIVPEENNLEDPVTGSAHTMAAPYWLGREASRARLPVATPGTVFAGDTLQARQVSARVGDLEVEWIRATGRTKLRGSTVVIMEGKIRAVE